jgi:hypothetical protein
MKFPRLRRRVPEQRVLDVENATGRSAPGWPTSTGFSALHQFLNQPDDVGGAWRPASSRS